MDKRKHNTPIIHNNPSTLSVIKSNILVIFSIFVIAFLIYGNSLSNEFAVIDDIGGYIENETIRNLPKSISTLTIQTIIYALNYTFFQLNPLPLRIFAIVNHAIVASILFLIISQLFNKKLAAFAAILFVVHPVTSEVLNWVSAQFYTVMTMFIYVSLWFTVKFRATGDKKYIYYILSLFALDILIIRHPWVFVIPFVVIAFDYFFLEKKSGQQFYKLFIVGTTILSLLFIFFHFRTQLNERMLNRNSSGKTLLNEQRLTPIIQSYPYTIYNVVRLYVFPKDLTIYYDGNKLSPTTYLQMYLIFFLYICSVIYFLFKNKKIAGLLLLPLIFILPVFSPKKVTWYITERYIYGGTGFFTTLIALSLLNLEKKLNAKHIALISASIIFFLYSYRTFIRNFNWKTPETLAIATIKTSPYSVRPYNDLAGYYVLQGNYSDAKKYYLQALQINSSLTAIRNLGHIFVETGLDPSINIETKPQEQIYAEAQRLIQIQDYIQAMYYLNTIIAQNPDHIEAWNRTIETYVLYDKLAIASQYLDQLETRQLMNADSYFIRAYIAYFQQNIELSNEYIQKVLELQPDHPGALNLRTNL